MTGKDRYQKDNSFAHVVCLKNVRWANKIYYKKWETNNKNKGAEKPTAAVVQLVEITKEQKTTREQRNWPKEKKGEGNREGMQR